MIASVGLKKLELLQCQAVFHDTYNHFDAIPAWDRRTDGRTGFPHRYRA